MLTWLFLAITVVVSTAGQLFLKAGMNHVGSVEQMGQLFSSDYIARVAGTWQVWVGLFMYGLGALSWLVVISRENLTYAYPFLGLIYILILITGYFVLGEPVRWWQIAGTLLVAGGVVLVARGA